MKIFECMNMYTILIKVWFCKFEWKKRNQCFYDKCSVQIKMLKTEFLEYEWLKWKKNIYIMSFRSFISTGLGTKIQVKIKLHIKARKQIKKCFCSLFTSITNLKLFL